MRIRRLRNLIQSTLKKIHYSLEIRMYDNFTIAEYFRKQGAQVGDGCVFSIRDIGTEPYLVKIGNNVAVTSGVTFNTHDGGTWVFREEIPDLRVFGPIIIKDNCLIGTNSQIFPDVTIGPNSIVASGSVVIRDVPPDTIVMGIPARQFGSVTKFKEKCIEKWNIQKPPGFNMGTVRHYDSLEKPELVLALLREHLSKVFADKL